MSFEPEVEEGRVADGERRLFFVIFLLAESASLLSKKSRCICIANSAANTVLTGGCQCFIVVRRLC